MVLADCCRPLCVSAISCSCRPREASANLSNSCTCSLERFSSAQNDTFVDSELCSYTGDSTPLLKLSDYYSTCEVVQVISSSHISRTDSRALAANMLNCVPVLHHAFCVRSRRF
ncbi:hypothetical protein TNCV_2593251 [Trichonephila clavipes]|nr:hypothetical protein TNCV_2593251 [Trichonephila clavipes]